MCIGILLEHTTGDCGPVPGHQKAILHVFFQLDSAKGGVIDRAKGGVMKDWKGVL